VDTFHTGAWIFLGLRAIGHPPSAPSDCPPSRVSETYSYVQYNEEEVKLELDLRQGVDLSEYSPSSIWDVVDVPAVLVSHRSRIEYQIKIR
jgi:hypothetical protein